MRRTNPIQKVIIAGVVLILAVILYFYPPVNQRLAWRIDLVLTYLRGFVQPPGDLPTSVPQPTKTTLLTATLTPEATNPPPPPAATQTGPTITPLPSPTPLPGSVSLPSPAYERQDWNNCAPATLTMYLRFYAWEGDQRDIAKVVKPYREDRNVSVDELVYYMRNFTGWLNIEYRVGGNIDGVKRFLAAGFPVMIEESTLVDQPFWRDDDQWAGHYLLLTGYDDATQVFSVQDSYKENVKTAAYANVEKNWQAFNNVYILVYRPDQADAVEDLFGEDWDVNANRQRTLDDAQIAVDQDPDNGFTWFNLGTNLVYLERYVEAAQTYDKAREVGLPQRMLLYQFGPYFAYFHSERFDDVLVLANYILQLPSKPSSEEAWLWHGWALYRKGDRAGAKADFQMALKANPHYQDAQYALDFLKNNP